MNSRKEKMVHWMFMIKGFSKNEVTKKNKKKRMLSAKDIAEILGVGRDKGYEIMNSKQFPTIHTGRMKLVHEDIFDQWLRGQRWDRYGRKLKDDI